MKLKRYCGRISTGFGRITTRLSDGDFRGARDLSVEAVDPEKKVLERVRTSGKSTFGRDRGSGVRRLAPIQPSLPIGQSDF